MGNQQPIDLSIRAARHLLSRYVISLDLCDIQKLMVYGGPLDEDTIRNRCEQLLDVVGTALETRLLTPKDGDRNNKNKIWFLCRVLDLCFEYLDEPCLGYRSAVVMVKMNFIYPSTYSPETSKLIRMQQGTYRGMASAYIEELERLRKENNLIYDLPEDLERSTIGHWVSEGRDVDYKKKGIW